jgi:hypothetical protein
LRIRACWRAVDFAAELRRLAGILEEPGMIKKSKKV